MYLGLMAQNTTPCHTGDYDGDKGWYSTTPYHIVQNFRNADIKYSYKPEGLADNFSRSAGAVSDVLDLPQLGS